MEFASTRLITDDVARLAGFYQAVLERAATWLTDEFAEIRLPGATLAIGATRTMALFGAGAARPGANASAILEFRVADVDAHLEAHRDQLTEVVQAPTTQPWGNRSLLVRDPDGTLVNFFTPVSAEARARYGL